MRLMNMRAAACALLLVSLAGFAGPISKFDKLAAKQIQSDLTLETVERCLIDLDKWGMAVVYRQPDRPDKVTILWPKGGQYAGNSNVRVDLVRKNAGVEIYSWMPGDAISECASI